jgi:hypothetical protein
METGDEPETLPRFLRCEPFRYHESTPDTICDTQPRRTCTGRQWEHGRGIEVLTESKDDDTLVLERRLGYSDSTHESRQDDCGSTLHVIWILSMSTIISRSE